jgi:hypothetical protein
MNCKKYNGFTLIVVITMIALMGAMFVVLGEMSRTFVFETNTAYLDACSRNLSASGFAWAKYNVKNKGKKFPAGRIPVDVTDMNMPVATLSLDVGQNRGGKTEVIIHVSVSRGEQLLRKETTYLISAPRPATRLSTSRAVAAE